MRGTRDLSSHAPISLADHVPGIHNGHAITIAELLNMTAGVYNVTVDPTFILPKRHATIVVEANTDNLSSMVARSILVALASYLFPQQFPNGS